MKQVIVNAIFKLKRDNDYNYEKIKDSYILKNGEMILVDTARNGLRVKIGDGVSTYAQLPFADEAIAANVINKGYLRENQFYSDASYTNVIPASVNKIYVELKECALYIYENDKYIQLTQKISLASATEAGIMKLYDTIGDNEDGTMSQKAITEELDDKVELDVDHENELLIFTTDN